LAKFRVPAEEIPGLLGQLSNVAAATGQPLADLAEKIGQLNAEGVSQSRILTALARSGVNVYGALAQSMGLTVDQVKKLATDGKLSEENILGMVEALSKLDASAAAAAADTMAGKMTILGNEAELAGERLGSALLPAVKEVADVFVAVANAIDKVPEPIITFAAEVATAVVAAKLLAAGLRSVIALLPITTAEIAAEGAASATAAVETTGLAVAMNTLKVNAGIVGLVIAGVGLAAYKIIPQLRGASDAAEEFGAGLDFSSATSGATDTLLLVKEMSDRSKEFGNAWKDAGVTVGQATNNLLKGGRAYDDMLARINAQIAELETHVVRSGDDPIFGLPQTVLSGRGQADEEAALARLRDLWVSEHDAIAAAREAQKQANTAMVDTGTAAGVGADGLDDLTDSADAAKEALKAAQEAGKDFADSLVDAFDKSFQAATTRLDLNAELAATLGPNGTEVQGLKEINKQLHDQTINTRDAAAQREKLISQSAQLAAKQRDQLLSEGVGLDEANKAYRKILQGQEDQLRKLGLLDAQTRQYFETLKALPAQQQVQIKAVLDLPTVDEQKAAVLELAERMPNAAVQLGAVMKPDWFKDADFTSSLLSALGPEGLEIAVKPIITPAAAADAAKANADNLRRAQQDARVFGDPFVAPKKLTADDFMDAELRKLLSGGTSTATANVNVVTTPPASTVKGQLDQAADPSGTGAGRTANINVTTTGTSPTDTGTQLDQAANPNGQAREAGIQVKINPVPAQQLLDSLKFEQGTKTDRVAGIQVRINPQSLATAQAQLTALSNTSIVLYPTISQQALNNITSAVRGAVSSGQSGSGGGGGSGSSGATPGGRSVNSAPRVQLTVQDGALANLVGVTVHDSVTRSVRTITNRKVVHV
jgi:tape measure domain-containing protein